MLQNLRQLLRSGNPILRTLLCRHPSSRFTKASIHRALKV
jgi:hypothetical protein